MRFLVPFFKHRRDTVFPMSSPRSVTAMHVPSPTRTPEEKAEGFQHDEDQEQSKQRAETTKAISKSEWTMKRHSISITIEWIWRRRGLTRRRLDGDGRTLGNASLKSKEG